MAGDRSGPLRGGDHDGARRAWERLPPWLDVIPPLLYIAAVAALRHATGGGASGFSPLFLVPVLWLAMSGNRRQLVAGLAAVAIAMIVPIVVGDPAYAVGEWRRLVNILAVGTAVGFYVQRLVQELHLQTRADALTGAANRRALDDALAVALADAQRSGRPVSVAMLDLDHFKRYNDAHGHQAGDQMLHATAEAWMHELRPGDVLARYGGEEFLAVVPSCDVAGAVIVADRLRAVVPDPQTASAGTATWDCSESAESLVGRADAALYVAKDSGRDRTVSSEALDPEPRP